MKKTYNKEQITQDLKRRLETEGQNEGLPKQEILAQEYGTTQSQINRIIRNDLKYKAIDNSGLYEKIVTTPREEYEKEFLDNFENFLRGHTILNPNIYVIPVEKGHSYWMKDKIDKYFGEVIISSVPYEDSIMIVTDKKKADNDNSFDDFFKRVLKKKYKPHVEDDQHKLISLQENFDGL